jgi:hypothetical protein
MSTDPLATYLQDHLAGAVSAIELLEMLRDQHKGESVGALAARLVVEVEADRGVLEALARRVAAGSSLLKDATGWLGAKISQLKLSHQTAGTLGTFQALETLALGVLGKLALWHALIEIGPSDARLSGVDFPALAARAQAQHARVEGERLALAHTALRTSSAKMSYVDAGPALGRHSRDSQLTGAGHEAETRQRFRDVASSEASILKRGRSDSGPKRRWSQLTGRHRATESRNRGSRLVVKSSRSRTERSLGSITRTRPPGRSIRRHSARVAPGSARR